MGHSPHDDIQELRDEVAGLRAELRSRREGPRPWTRAVTRLRSMRRLTVVGIAALMLAVPVAVSASHVFSDVPTSNTFHTQIARLVGAGITGGCGSGKYCPNDPVTRGQMAAFFNRGLGRGTEGIFAIDDWDDLVLEEGAIVSEADMISGGGGGGTGHVLGTGYLTLWTNEPGVCPCEVQLTLYNPTTGDFSPTVFDAIGGDAVPTDDTDLEGPFWEATVNISYLFTVPSGSNQTYQLISKVVPTTTPSTPVDPMVTGWLASMEVVYVPWAGDGGNPVLPDTVGGQEPRQPRGSH